MDAVAIQDANKIRVAMGLAPLPVPGQSNNGGLEFQSKGDGSDDDSDDSDRVSTLEKRAAAAGDNWKKLQEEERVKAERVARKEAAKKARDAAARFAKLEGKGLGDADDNEVDTKTWLLQQKKRQKRIDKARQYEEEQAAREAAAQAEYTARDLAGVKVGHELDEFAEGSEQVLTLKDTEIGGDDDDEEGDELENLDLRAQERLNEKLENKKKKPVYNPNDMDDDEGERKILAQYDEEIDGKRKKAFTLDGRGNVAKAAPSEQEAQHSRSKGIKISLDLLKDDTPMSDYQDPVSIKVRKPRKAKKAKTARKKAVDDDDEIIHPPSASAAPAIGDSADPNAMQVDTNGTGTAKKRALEFDDDDDLQARLAEQRRQALKKRKKTDAAELARRIREEESSTPMETGDEEEPGMVIDETSEFVSNLNPEAVREREEERRRRAASSGPDATREGDANNGDGDGDGDADMQESYGALEDEAHKSSTTPAAPVTSTGFEEEETMSSGVGASLNMLRKRGLVSDSGAGEQNAKDRARAQFLAENRALIAEYDHKTREDREHVRTTGRWNRMSRAEQEAYNRQENERREAFLARLQADHYKKNYRPDVKLEYHDEFGREMNQKEAFKHLSHQFHGKGSGKQKTEKRLKKIDDEKRREAMSSLDNSGMNNAMGAQARKNRQAGVRLQ